MNAMRRMIVVVAIAGLTLACGCASSVPHQPQCSPGEQRLAAGVEHLDFDFGLGHADIQALDVRIPLIDLRGASPLEAIQSVVCLHRQACGDLRPLSFVVLTGDAWADKAQSHPRITLEMRETPTWVALQALGDMLGLDIVIESTDSGTRAAVISDPFMKPVRTRIRSVSPLFVRSMGIKEDGVGPIDVGEWFASRGVKLPPQASAFYYPAIGVLGMTNTGRGVELMDALVVLHQRGMAVSAP